MIWLRMGRAWWVETVGYGSASTDACASLQRGKVLRILLAELGFSESVLEWWDLVR